MPRSTAARMSEIPVCLSTAGPSPKLSPMQPRPIADTSRLLFPSLRFCNVFRVASLAMNATSSFSKLPMREESSLKRIPQVLLIHCRLLQLHKHSMDSGLGIKRQLRQNPNHDQNSA